MSIRREPVDVQTSQAAQLKQDLESLRAVHLRNEATATEAGEGGAELTMNDLNETERSAASLGVSPSALKPIGFMNSAHYDLLLKKNVLSGPLAQKIEAYRTVSEADAACAAGCK